MKRFLLFLTILFTFTFTSCVTLPGADKHDENPQVTANTISVRTEYLAEQIVDISTEVKKIEREVTTIDFAIDGMKAMYDIKSDEARYYKERYEKLYEMYKAQLQAIFDENPDEKKNLKKLNPEAYRLIYEEVE